MKVVPSTRCDKRFMTTIRGKTYHFGAPGAQTYLEHKDEKIKSNWIKRHRVREDWTRVNPGSLSRWLLWGDHTSLKKNIEDFRKRYGIE